MLAAARWSQARVKTAGYRKLCFRLLSSHSLTRNTNTETRAFSLREVKLGIRRVGSRLTVLSS